MPLSRRICWRKISPRKVAFCLLAFVFSLSLVTFTALSRRVKPTMKKYDEDVLIYKENHWTVNELEEEYFRLITIDDVECATSKLVGAQEKYMFGWEICLDDEFKPIKNNCIVYDFGIKNQWDFDDELDKDFGCKVYSFDSSMKITDHSRSENVNFFNIGLGSFDGKQESGHVKTFPTLLKQFSHSNKQIDIVKINIDYAEWDALEQAVKFESLRNVKQLIFESNTQPTPIKNSFNITRDMLLKYIEVWLDVRSFGFRQWTHRINPTNHYVSANSGVERACCHDHYLININYFETN